MIRGLRGTVLVDSLGPWVSSSTDMEVDADALCAALVERHGDTVVVSEEVGLSVHPSTAAGRRFRDVLGLVNQAVAARADEVLLVVAGRTLRLAGPSRLMRRRRRVSHSASGGARSPSAGALDWFPFVGAAIGLAVGGDLVVGACGRGLRPPPPPWRWHPTSRSPDTSTSTGWLTPPTGCCRRCPVTGAWR